MNSRGVKLLFSEIVEKDRQDVVDLFTDCFEEIPEAVELIMDYLGKGLTGYKTVLDDRDGFSEDKGSTSGNIIALVFAMECSLEQRKAHYIFGVCTDKEYRGRGIMKKLMDFVLDERKKRGESYSLLFPAEESLYEFYEKMGYERKCKAHREASELVYDDRVKVFARDYYEIYGEIIFDENGDIMGFGEGDPGPEVDWGVIKSLDSSPLPGNTYIGITLK